MPTPLKYISEHLILTVVAKILKYLIKTFEDQIAWVTYSTWLIPYTVLTIKTKLYHTGSVPCVIDLSLLCSKFYVLFFQEFSQNFTHYSFVLSYYSKKYTSIRNTSFRKLESQSLMLANKMLLGCSIKVFYLLDFIDLS